MATEHGRARHKLSGYDFDGRHAGPRAARLVAELQDASLYLIS